MEIQSNLDTRNSKLKDVGEDAIFLKGILYALVIIYTYTF